MRRTGNHIGPLALLLVLPLLAQAEVVFRQDLDREQVGLDDTFTLTVTIEDPPARAEVQFPASSDFELMSRSQSSQRYFQFGSGGNGFRQVERYTLVMRPLRAGRITIPPAKLKSPHGTLQTAPLSLTVKAGRAAPSGNRRQPRLDPFAGMAPLPGFDDDSSDDSFTLPEESIPHSDSDLFLRAYLDRSSAFVGEQVTYSLYVFARVDLSSVDSETLPKMDGFWAEEVESPARLAAEPRTLDGVPYQAYLIKRRALFPEKAGEVEIPAASADVTTGFLFSGRRIHRQSNTLKLTVKPAPPGAPPEFRPEQVGEWKLSQEAQPSEVELGQPITVRVILEGRGNLRRMVLPRFPATSGLKFYDPTTTDSATTRQGRLGGRKVQEYLVMPQRTGSFNVPVLRFVYFNPKSGHYQTSETSPISVQVKPGPTSGKDGGLSGPLLTAPGAKNVLSGGTLRPLRAEAVFDTPGNPPWRQPLFFALALGPLGAYAATLAVAQLRGRAARTDPAAQQRRKAKAAKERLSRARRLMEAPADAFYGEVERALVSSLELKLGIPVGGLVRSELQKRLEGAEYPEEQRVQVLRLLETCESARYAPGLADANRTQVLADATAVLMRGES